MALGWREHLAFDLAHVGSQRLAETALAVRLDLRARRRLEILAEPLDLLLSQRQPHSPFRDPRHLLRGHVARLSERARRYRQPIEDVSGVVACHLVDLAHLAAISGKHLPAGPDHQPGNGIAHRLDSPAARAAQCSLARTGPSRCVLSPAATQDGGAPPQ